MSCRFSRNGRFIATASFDRTMRVWDARTGEVLHILRGFTSPVRTCSFNADGQFLVCGDWAKTIHILEWESEREVAIYPAMGNLLSCDFSPAEDVLAAGDEANNMFFLRLVGQSRAVYHDERSEAL
jgi:WD40 repeat protein